MLKESEMMMMTLGDGNDVVRNAISIEDSEDEGNEGDNGATKDMSGVDGRTFII